jgi:hypothetical protein
MFITFITYGGHVEGRIKYARFESWSGSNPPVSW